MRGVPAQDGSSDVLLATPPGGSLRARWAGPQLAGPGGVPPSLSGRPSGPLTGRQTPQAAGVPPPGAPPARAPGAPGSSPRAEPRGRGYRVADVEHALAG